MNYKVAEFWAETITKLLTGKRVVFIDSAEHLGWQPRSEIATITKSSAYEYEYERGVGFFHVNSSYGVHAGLDCAKIAPDQREIVMHSEGKNPRWLVIRAIDADNCPWDEWRLALESHLSLMRKLSA